MTTSIDDMTIVELRAENWRLSVSVKALGEQLKQYEANLRELTDIRGKDYEAGNVAVGAIYLMVELIREARVTHAQREGQLVLLLAYIDKKWPSHSARFLSHNETSDIPF